MDLQQRMFISSVIDGDSTFSEQPSKSSMVVTQTSVGK